MRTYNSVQLNDDGEAAVVYRGRRQNYIGTLLRTRIGWYDATGHPTNPATAHYRSLEAAVANLAKTSQLETNARKATR